MKPLKSKVSITLDEDIIQEIKKLAEKDDRSFSQYINMVLNEYLSKKDKAIKKRIETFCDNNEDKLFHLYKQLSSKDKKEIEELIEFKISRSKKENSSNAKSSTLTDNLQAK